MKLLAIVYNILGNLEISFNFKRRLHYQTFYFNIPRATICRPLYATTVSLIHLIHSVQDPFIIRITLHINLSHFEQSMFCNMTYPFEMRTIPGRHDFRIIFMTLGSSMAIFAISVRLHRVNRYCIQQ